MGGLSWKPIIGVFVGVAVVTAVIVSSIALAAAAEVIVPIVIDTGAVEIGILAVTSIIAGITIENTIINESRDTKKYIKGKAARPELKKQGREGTEKKKQKNWVKRSGKKEREQPRPHHPGREHTKYSRTKNNIVPK